MQALISNLAKPFKKLRLPIPISRQTPRVDDSAEQHNDPSANQDAIIRSSDGDQPIKPSTRQKLNDMLTLRIHPSELEFPSGDADNSGGKADVAKATYQRSSGGRKRVVAVKKLRYHRDMKRKKFGNEFVHEVELLASMGHLNIIRLIGFVEDLDNGTAWIVLSWEPNGNVSEFLKKGEFAIPERVSLIKDIFQGVRFLHTLKPPICHGDLKSLNILIDCDYHAVITDFGSAREINAAEDEGMGHESGPEVQGHRTTEQGFEPIHIHTAGSQLTLTGPAWSLRWAAPEVMNGKRPGLSSDIWAAGWVCWEVMTDKVPFPELNAAGAVTLSVIRGRVPAPDQDGQLGQIRELCCLMTDCWAFNPKARPDVSVCCNKLYWMPSTTPSGGNSGPKLPSINLLMRKGQMHYNHCEPQKATVLFQQALDLARSAGEEMATASALFWLGNAYVTQSKYSQAEASYDGAQKIYARIGHVLGRATVLDGLGDAYLAQSKYIQAEESYIRAHELYSRTNTGGQANTLRGLGHLYRFQSEFSRAAEFYTRAEEIYGLIGDDTGRAHTLDGLGHLYLEQSQYSKAEELYGRADEIHARMGNDQGRANAFVGLGHVYRCQSKYPEAEKSYTRALEIYARIGDHLGRANALRGFGHLRRDQGRNAEASAHYTNARDLYAQIGKPSAAEHASLLLAGVLPGGATL